MDIKCNITGHNIIIADITGYFLLKLCVRRQGELLPDDLPLKKESSKNVSLGLD